jgi:threonine dehydratase
MGAFKFRGALNAIRQLDASIKTVITHSSGNHAQAIALAASIAGLHAHVVMPVDSPGCKVAAVKGYGATVRIRLRTDYSTVLYTVLPLVCALAVG